MLPRNVDVVGEHCEIDLLFGGRQLAICTHRIGDVLVDPGPQSCSATLLRALNGWQPRAILLTHIHLDHAAATGSLLRDWPGTEVWVHERGARHMVDPSRLIASAERIYGDRMRELWGEIAPVPEDALVVLEGGETRDGFAVAHTPGHASHHVSYLHLDSQIAFTGDVAGVRIADGPVVAPTPPPDIDLVLWAQSIAKLRDWAPRALAVTHYGTFYDVDQHLDALERSLGHWGKRALEVTPEQFEREMLDYTGTAHPYTLAMPTSTLQAGLLRYWQKDR